MVELSVMKALADETRMRIVTLLLESNYCVRALANELRLTDATISQHLKVLREAGIVVGEKRGYFMHYAVERSVLQELAQEIKKLAATKRKKCQRIKGNAFTVLSNPGCPEKIEMVCPDEIARL